MVGMMGGPTAALLVELLVAQSVVRTAAMMAGRKADPMVE